VDVLPDAATFDGFVDNLQLENRADFLRDFYQKLDVLTMRAGRQRALLALALHEERGLPYRRIGALMGVSRMRAFQLSADGQQWREFDGREAVSG
jgi:hypothetical protein